MKKSKLTGWKHVYQFTIEQNIKNKSFIVSTVVITLLIMILCVCVNFLPAVIYDMSSDKQKELKVDNVYIYDQSGLTELDYAKLKEQKDSLKDIGLNSIASESEKENLDSEGKRNVMIEIKESETGYDVVASIPDKSEASKGNAKTIARYVADYFREQHCAEYGITSEQIAFNDLSISTNVVDLGEDNNIIILLVEYFVYLVIYMLFVILINTYGRMTSGIVAMEKSGKVMELLLTSIRPLATIVGKILAMTTLIVGQIVLWVIVGVASYFGSNAIFASIDGKYANGLSKFFDLLKGAGLTLNLSPIAIVLAALIVITGFTIYNSIAGFIGATVSKIEELGQAIQSLAFFLLVGAYIPLFGLINMITSENMQNTLLVISRVLPLSSFYVVPLELILGTGKLSDAFIALGLNVLTLAIIMLLISRVYEAVVLHSGNRLKIKDIIKISKNK